MEASAGLGIQSPASMYQAPTVYQTFHILEVFPYGKDRISFSLHLCEADWERLEGLHKVMVSPPERDEAGP